MSNMKTVVVHNQTERGVHIGDVYVPAGGSERVDPTDEYMQNLVRRGSLVIVEPVAQAVDEPVDTEEVEEEAAEAVEEEISESEVTSTEDEPSAAPVKKAAKKSSSSCKKTTRS